MTPPPVIDGLGFSDGRESLRWGDGERSGPRPREEKRLVTILAGGRLVQRLVRVMPPRAGSR